MTKKSWQKRRYLENEKNEIKIIFIILKELSVIKTCLRPYSASLKSDSHLPPKMCHLLYWKPFKNHEKNFLFHLKRLFGSQDV